MKVDSFYEEIYFIPNNFVSDQNFVCLVGILQQHALIRLLPHLLYLKIIYRPEAI